MTARDELAALLSSALGANPLGAGLDKWYLDAIASLAINPETAPAVFRWLVEAGVLQAGDEPCDCTQVPIVAPARLPWGSELRGHYHAVLGGVEHG